MAVTTPAVSNGTTSPVVSVITGAESPRSTRSSRGISGWYRDYKKQADVASTEDILDSSLAVTTPEVSKGTTVPVESVITGSLSPRTARARHFVRIGKGGEGTRVHAIQVPHNGFDGMWSSRGKSDKENNSLKRKPHNAGLDWDPVRKRWTRLIHRAMMGRPATGRTD